MKTLRCSDSALIQIAEETALEALRHPGHSLQARLAELERSPWPGMALTPGQRKALRSMTSALCARTAGPDRSGLTAILTSHTAEERSVA